MRKTPALTEDEKASIPPMQDEVDQAEKDAEAAILLREAAQERKDKKK